VLSLINRNAAVVSGRNCRAHTAKWYTISSVTVKYCFTKQWDQGAKNDGPMRLLSGLSVNYTSLYSAVNCIRIVSLIHVHKRTHAHAHLFCVMLLPLRWHRNRKTTSQGAVSPKYSPVCEVSVWVKSGRGHINITVIERLRWVVSPSASYLGDPG
jgi:hypothetical protein